MEKGLMTETGLVTQTGLVTETGPVVEAGLVTEIGLVTEAGLVTETGLARPRCSRPESPAPRPPQDNRWTGQAKKPPGFWVFF